MPVDKKLVVFYSFEGNCRELGGIMAEAVGADAVRIEPVREISRGAVMKYLKGGRGAVMKERAELLPLSVDVREYGLVIVGTPVWAWNLPPATRSFLEGQDWHGIKTALYAMHRGGPGGVLKAMRGIIEASGGGVVGTADFRDLRLRDSAKTKAMAADWAAEMLRLAEQAV